MANLAPGLEPLRDFLPTGAQKERRGLHRGAWRQADISRRRQTETEPRETQLASRKHVKPVSRKSKLKREYEILRQTPGSQKKHKKAREHVKKPSPGSANGSQCLRLRLEHVNVARIESRIQYGLATPRKGAQKSLWEVKYSRFKIPTPGLQENCSRTPSQMSSAGDLPRRPHLGRRVVEASSRRICSSASVHLVCSPSCRVGVVRIYGMHRNLL